MRHAIRNNNGHAKRQILADFSYSTLIDRIVLRRTMAKDTANPFYAVARGRNPGVYRSWDECEKQVKGIHGARYRKFYSEADAFAYVEQHSTEPTPGASVGPNKAEAGTSSRSSKSLHAHKPREGWLTVYCDGASKNNGKPNAAAGVGVWWGMDDERNISERCPGAQTNNRAELIALARVLETAPINAFPLLVRTDSKYTINCFTEWITSWHKSAWMNSKGEPVKNREVICYIDALLEKRKSFGQKVELDYVPGHKGHEGNEGADGLANAGCILPALDDRDWVALEADVRRTMHSEVVPAQPFNPSVDESISAALSRNKGKSRAVESPISEPNHDIPRTLPIDIPIKLKWAAYEPIPDDWLVNPSQSSPSSSVTNLSISFSSTSASTSSLSSVDSNASHKDRQIVHTSTAGSEQLSEPISAEVLKQLFMSNEDLAREVAEEED